LIYYQVRRNGVVYHLTPELWVGTEMVLLGNRLAQLRFQARDWAWFIPALARDGGEGDEGSDAGVTMLERALIINAAVARGRMVYHIHLPESRCDRVFVTDDQLEEVVELDVVGPETQLQLEEAVEPDITSPQTMLMSQ
jgi:hypothetical protein